MSEVNEITEKDEQALGHTVVKFFPRLAKWMFPLAVGFGGLSLGGGASTWMHSKGDTQIDSGLVMLRKLQESAKEHSEQIAELNRHVTQIIAVIDSTPTGKRMEREYRSIHHGSPFAIEVEACNCSPVAEARHN